MTTTTQATTLRDFIEMLEEAAATYGDDAPVRIAQPAHDYWRTTLAVAPQRVDLLPIQHSAYYDSETVCDEEPEDYDATPRAVVLYCR